MKLIVGLGNPGREYAGTRHNVGFMVVEQIADRRRVSFRKSARFKAQTAKIPSLEGGVLLAEPTTFMNLSGWAVRELAAFHKLAPSDLLVVVDDADLPLGRLRARAGGSAGGHNGLKSIIEELGTENFPRLRIGVGRQGGELRNHVLGRFGSDEQPQVETAVDRAADAAELFVTEGILAVMNRFNAAQAVEE